MPSPPRHGTTVARDVSAPAVRIKTEANLVMGLERLRKRCKDWPPFTNISHSGAIEVCDCFGIPVASRLGHGTIEIPARLNSCVVVSIFHFSAAQQEAEI